MSTNAASGKAAACARVRERLVELVDGGLGGLEAARDRGHLEACEACQAARQRLEAWLVGVRSAFLPALVEVREASQGLDARLAGGPPPQRTGLALVLGVGGRRAAVAVSLAASALIALVLLRGFGAVQSPLGGLVGGALRGLERGSLPDLDWPTGPKGLWTHG